MKDIVDDLFYAPKLISKEPQWQMCHFITFGHAIVALLLVMIFWKF